MTTYPYAAKGPWSYELTSQSGGVHELARPQLQRFEYRGIVCDPSLPQRLLGTPVRRSKCREGREGGD